MLKRKRKLSVERNRKRVAWLFMLPWLIGVISFFIVPFIDTIIYSLSDVRISPEQIGLQTEWVGGYNYNYVLFRDAGTLQMLWKAVTELLYTVPVVLIFSIFIALLLNQKFKGRAIMRSVFFLPVIIAAGVVINIIKGDVLSSNILSENVSFFQTDMIEEVLLRSGIPAKLVGIVTTVTSGIFDLSWKSGVQIILFISALQGIPEAHYEAASVEGANAWEKFWHITFPALVPTCLLVSIYTVIDTFIDPNSPVMKKIIERFDNFYYGLASATAMLYFATIILFILIVVLIFNSPNRNKKAKGVS